MSGQNGTRAMLAPRSPRGRSRVVLRRGERGQRLERDADLQDVPVVECEPGCLEQETLCLGAVIGEEMGSAEHGEVDLLPVGGPSRPPVADAFGCRVDQAGLIVDGPTEQPSDEVEVAEPVVIPGAGEDRFGLVQHLGDAVGSIGERQCLGGTEDRPDLLEVEPEL